MHKNESRCFWGFIWGLTVVLPLPCVAADPLDVWHWRNPLPHGESLTSITYAQDQFLAIGDDGALGRSPDGVHWEFTKVAAMRSPANADNQWSSVAFGNDTYVAVGVGHAYGTDGSFGIVTTSSDGTNWTATVQQGRPGIAAVTYGAGLFVAVEYGSVMTSTDGKQWKDALTTTNRLTDIGFGNGTFVATGDSGALLTSTNGVQWDRVTLEAPYSLRAVGFGEGAFVAAGINALLTSTNAVTWIKRLTNVFLTSVSYGGGTFVAAGDRGPIFVSTNAVDWTKRTLGEVNIYEMAYGEGKFVSVGGPPNAMLTSTNGFDWTGLGFGSFQFADYNDVAYGAGRFVAVGGSLGDSIPFPTLTSTDGINWVPNAWPMTTPELRAVTFGRDLFVAVGWDGTILSSSDGLVWTHRRGSSPSNPVLNSVRYGNGRYVAVGDKTILVSSNAVDWVARSFGLANDFYCLAYGNGLFVVGGNEGILLTSTDGERWTIQNSGTTSRIDALGYGNGLFVALTPRLSTQGFGSVLTSSNGVDWVSRPLPGRPGYSKVTYGHGTFVAVGNGFDGYVSTSSNGLNWIERNLGTDVPLMGVAYGKRSFIVAGGYYGAVLQSDELPPPDLKLESVVRRADGSFLITVSGTPGENWQIQASSDLIEWSTLGSFFMPDRTSEVIVPEPGTTSSATRFFRAVGE